MHTNDSPAYDSAHHCHDLTKVLWSCMAGSIKNNMILNIFQFKDDDNWKPEII